MARIAKDSALVLHAIHELLMASYFDSVQIDDAKSDEWRGLAAKAAQALTRLTEKADDRGRSDAAGRMAHLEEGARILRAMAHRLFDQSYSLKAWLEADAKGGGDGG